VLLPRLLLLLLLLLLPQQRLEFLKGHAKIQSFFLQQHFFNERLNNASCGLVKLSNIFITLLTKHKTAE